MDHILSRWRYAAVLTAAFAVAGFGLVAALASSPAAHAAPSYSITFDSVGAGSSAGWNTAHSAAVLTVGANTAWYNARVILHGFTEDSTMPSTDPTFTSDAYGGSNPRLVVETGESAFYFRYPTGSSGCSAGDCWALNTAPATMLSYSEAEAAINAQGGVNEAWIVTDGGGDGSGFPYTVNITGFTWDGQQLIPGTPPTTVKAWATNRCQTWQTRHWGIRNLGPATPVTVRYYTQRAGSWVWAGKVSAPLGTRVYVVTHHGNDLQARFWNGYAHKYVYVQNGVHC